LIGEHHHLRLVLLVATVWHLVAVLHLVRGWTGKTQLLGGEDAVGLGGTFGDEEFLAVVGRVFGFPRKWSLVLVWSLDAALLVGVLSEDVDLFLCAEEGVDFLRVILCFGSSVAACDIMQPLQISDGSCSLDTSC
jgi:hypothetical protein